MPFWAVRGQGSCAIELCTCWAFIFTRPKKEIIFWILIFKNDNIYNTTIPSFYYITFWHKRNGGAAEWLNVVSLSFHSMLLWINQLILSIAVITPFPISHNPQLLIRGHCCSAMDHSGLRLVHSHYYSFFCSAHHRLCHHLTCGNQVIVSLSFTPQSHPTFAVFTHCPCPSALCRLAPAIWVSVPSLLPHVTLVVTPAISMDTSTDLNTLLLLQQIIIYI